jgi:hypothetical protein
MPLSPPALAIVWTLFAVLAVLGFVMIAAYWLDVQDRPDLSWRARVGWSFAIFLFPVAIPTYAFAGGPSWPLALRIGSLVPGVALALFLAFAFGFFT